MNIIDAQLVKHIHNILSTQEFTDWYNGEFEDYIRGEEDCKDMEEIIEDIKQIFS